MDQEIIKVLKQFNLNEKEACIYIASLQVGKGTVYEIAKKAGIKRPTAYVLIDDLINKGIIATHREKNRTICSPLPPLRLIETWKGRLDILESITPELNAFYQSSLNQPKILVFEGEEGIDRVYNELTPKGLKKEEIFLFGSISALKKKFSHRFPVWEKMTKNRNNIIKELINSEEGSLKYAQKQKELGNPNYEIRITKQNVFGACDNIIYKNKVAVFSLKKELFVIIIESEEIAKTYQAIFQMAWESARQL